MADSQSHASASASPQREGRLSALRPELRIFILLLVVFASLTKSTPESANDSSRLDQIESIVERRTLVIDGAPFSTVDKYQYQGRFYSDKPPLMALAASPLYAAIRTALPSQIEAIDMGRRALHDDAWRTELCERLRQPLQPVERRCNDSHSAAIL